MWFLKKTSPRRNQVRRSMAAERLSQISRFATTERLVSALLWLLFVVLCIPVISLELIKQADYLGLFSKALIVVLISLGAAFYIHHYQGRIIKNHARALALVGLFILLLVPARLGAFVATGTAVTTAIILTIAYDQRFAIGMSIFYCLFACLAAEPKTDINLLFLFLIMAAGAITCCFFLREIRTRMKLLEVSALAAVIVFITALALGFLANSQTPFFALGGQGSPDRQGL